MIQKISGSQGGALLVAVLSQRMTDEMAQRGLGVGQAARARQAE